MKGISDTIQLKYTKLGSHWQLPACNLLVKAPSSGIGSRGTNLMPKYHEKGLVLLWSRMRKSCSSTKSDTYISFFVILKSAT